MHRANCCVDGFEVELVVMSDMYRPYVGAVFACQKQGRGMTQSVIGFNEMRFNLIFTTSRIPCLPFIFSPRLFLFCDGTTLPDHGLGDPI